MTKTELIAAISERTALPKSNVKAMVDAFSDAVAEALSEGDKVSIIGFGTFKVSERSERKARNPKTGEIITIPAHKVPAFTAGNSLKEAVNK